MLLNLSDHPFSRWSEKQKETAKGMTSTKAGLKRPAFCFAESEGFEPPDP